MLVSYSPVLAETMARKQNQCTESPELGIQVANAVWHTQHAAHIVKRCAFPLGLAGFAPKTMRQAAQSVLQSQLLARQWQRTTSVIQLHIKPEQNQ